MKQSVLAFLVICLLVLPVVAAPTISGGLPFPRNITGGAGGGGSLVNISYYLRDTSLTMTGQNIYRNTTFSNLNLYGGDVAAGQGGIVSVEGSDSGSADSIVFYSPDPGHSANLIAMAVNSLTTGIPYLTMKNHQIKYVLNPTDAQDAVTLAYYNAHLPVAGVTDHGALTGLADDDHTQYANLGGRTPGQTLSGGTLATGEALILNGTSASNPLTSVVLLQPKGGSVLINHTYAVPGYVFGIYGNTIQTGVVNPLILVGDDTLNGIYTQWNSASDYGIWQTLIAGSGFGTIAIQAGGGDVVIGSTTAAGRLKVAKNSGGALSLDSQSGILIKSTSNAMGLRIGVDESAKVSHIQSVESGVAVCDIALNSLGGNVTIGASPSTAQFDTTGTVRFRNFGAGTLMTDANGNLYVISDENVKNNIRPFGSGLAEILNVTPHTYKFNSASGLDTVNDYVGVIAQELQTVLPEAVYKKPDTTWTIVYNKSVEVPKLDKDGKQTTTLSVSNMPIIMAEVNAIKELNAKIEAQNKTIAEQELRIAALEKKVGI